ncbi:hypothetical protein JVT61DRAFT_4273 [Boletus reticuloceps]|uniref:Uncharacterized protein n=1 Tax=Boletus reticuloceps TaxID=495285 RepID=A0A8I3A8V2_9AGAM|nr:hypothetical protein JVT61DRAFT_4273 [Boletus reticuloceps]
MSKDVDSLIPDKELQDHGDLVPDNHDNNPPSQYNDGQGIQVSIAFTHHPPRTSNNQKRRKNAKSNPPITFFISMKLAASRIFSIQLLKSLCSMQVTVYAIVSATEVASSVLTTSRSNVNLTAVSNFDTLITEACKMKKNPNIKLFIVQTKYLDENDDEEHEDEDKASKPCCKQTVQPSKEEMKLNEHIAELSHCYACEDRACTFPICCLAGPTAKHVHLTPLHLRTWASAIISALHHLLMI